MHIAINDMAIIEKLGPERLRDQETMLRQAALIILDTNLRDDALAWLTETLAGKTIFVDTVSTVKAKKIRPYLAAIHTLKASLIEAEALSGMKARTQAERRKLAAWTHEKGVTRLFITLGKGGVFYSTSDAQGVEKLQRENKTLENAGGAGDAFVGGLAYAWLKDWSLMKSVRFALAAAEVTLSDSASSSPAVSLTAVNRVYEGQHVS
jgi:pseudouridine kinase